MCNLASEGGRCAAHIKQNIVSLMKKDDKNLDKMARESGVPVDQEALDKDLEQHREDNQNELQRLSRTQAIYIEQEVSAKMQAELCKKIYDENPDAQGVLNPSKPAGIRSLLGKKDNTPAPEEMPVFNNFKGTQDYIAAYRYEQAVNATLKQNPGQYTLHSKKVEAQQEYARQEKKLWAHYQEQNGTENIKETPHPAFTERMTNDLSKTSAVKDLNVYKDQGEYWSRRAVQLKQLAAEQAEEVRGLYKKHENGKATLRKKAKLDDGKLQEFKANVYAHTPEAKEIKAKIISEKKALLNTKSFRPKLEEAKQNQAERREPKVDIHDRLMKASGV